MSHYRIRREGMEFPVAGLEALVRLVQEGTLGPTDRVYEPATESWVPASQMGLLSTAFSDRAREQAARRNRSKRPRPSALPSAELGPMTPPSIGGQPSDDALFEIPADLEAPSAEHPAPAGHDASGAVIDGGNLRDRATPNLAAELRSSDPSNGAGSAKESGGEIIAFPDEDPHSARLATLPPFGSSLDPDQARAAIDNPGAFLRSADTPPAHQPKPAVRPALLLMTVIVGLVGAFILVSYIQHGANMYNARLTSPTGASDVGANPSPPSSPRTGAERGVGEVVSDATPNAGSSGSPGSDALYEDMELQLRNRMVPGCSTVSKEDDLDSALRIELSRLGVHADSIHAPVLTWGGRKGDVPHAVEIKIWYEGQPDELDRELGAIGLVVGKYAQQYGLDVRAFDINVKDSDGNARERSLDAAAAKQFYLRHIPLLQFLMGDAP